MNQRSRFEYFRRLWAASIYSRGATTRRALLGWTVITALLLTLQAVAPADDSVTQVQKQEEYETDTERMEIPPGPLDESAPEDYKTDTERMETLEGRLQTLEGKVSASSA